MDRERDESLRSRDWSGKFKNEIEPSHEVDPKHTEFNARVHQALADIPVPPTLRDQILARRKTVEVPFWRQPQNIASIAAALLIIATGLIFLKRLPQEDQTFGGFRARMVGFALREYRMDIHTNLLAEVQNFLAQNGAPAQFALPAPLASIPVKGGAKLAWQGKPVSMVCFTGSAGQTLYMFIIETALAASSAASAPEVMTIKNLSTATWAADGKTFLLAAPMTADELGKLVGTQRT